MKCFRFVKSEVKVLVAQPCPTLCDPMNSSPPGSSVHRMLWARILQWIVNIPFPGDLPNPGVKSVSLALQVDSLLSKPQGKPLWFVPPCFFFFFFNLPTVTFFPVVKLPFLNTHCNSGVFSNPLYSTATNIGRG